MTPTKDSFSRHSASYSFGAPQDLTLHTFPSAVSEILTLYVDDRIAEIVDKDPELAEFVYPLRDFVLSGGKRLRPLFAWAGFVGSGGLRADPSHVREDPFAVLRALSALELIQACALIHDDIIDSSDTRRGVPTLHKRAENRHIQEQWLGSSDHFGRSYAILEGDLALVYAEDMVRESGLSAAAYARLQAPWRSMRSEVIIGQLLDITVEAARVEGLQAPEKINRYKTAAYTIERPLHIGAAVADAPPSVIDALRAYGQKIGIAFQLRDDLLGIFGDPAITGKPAGDDIREGKRTVLIALALETLDSSAPKDAARLREGLGNVNDPADIAELIALVCSTDAPERVEQQIHALTHAGIAALKESDVDIDAHVVDMLETLAINATRRRH